MASPVGLLLPHVERQLDARGGNRASCGGGCATGLPANLNYTYSKSLDDDYSLGGQGPVVTNGGSQQVAQDWTHPARAARAVDVRPAECAVGAAAVHHWHGNRRTDAAERLARASSIKSGRCSCQHQRGQRHAGDAALLPWWFRDRLTRISSARAMARQTGCTQQPGAVPESLQVCGAGLGPYGNARRDSITGPEPVRR